MNREIYPGGVYPLSGDVQSQPGTATVSVVGILGIPVNAATFSGGEVLEFNTALGSWVPTLRAAIQVNKITVSDDYSISVNVLQMLKINTA